MKKFYLPTPCSASRGFTLVEVVVAMTILLGGIVGMAQFFPTALSQNRHSADVTSAAYLAQMKGEEVRRNDIYYALDTPAGTTPTIAQISQLAIPSTSTVFVEDDRFAYVYSGRSLMEIVNADSYNAFIIVQYNSEYRPDEEMLFELGL